MQSFFRPASPIRVDKPFYRGVIHHLLQFPEKIDTTTLCHMIERRRICASVSGMSVAAILSGGDLLDCVEHNIPGIPEQYFARWMNGWKIETQLLDVQDDHFLIWGLHESYAVLGVYQCSRKGIVLVHPTGRLQKIQRTKQGLLLFGTRSIEDDQTLLYSEHGVLSLDDTLTAKRLNDGSVMFLEKFGTQCVRYRLTRGGFEDWFPIPHARGESPFALARIGRQYILATHQRDRSYLRVLGGTRTLPFELKEQWDGRIEHLWQSPDERSLAWLIANEDGKDRQLYVNGILIQEGTFDMDASGLVWAQAGMMCGARIRVEQDGQDREHIVTPIEEEVIPIGSFVREFLVDVHGHIAATVIEDAHFSRPMIYDRPHTPTSLAWNLHWMPGGCIGYNSTLLSSVLHTTDEVNVKHR